MRPDAEEDLPALEIVGGADPQALEVGAEPGGSGRSLVLAAVGVLILAGLVSWVFSTGSEDSPADESAQTTEPESVEPIADVEAPLPREDLLVELAAFGLDGGFAYASDENVVVVDLRDGEVTSAVPETYLTDLVPRFVVVNDGVRSLAVDPADPAFPFVVTAQSRVVETARANEYVLLDDPLNPETIIVGTIDLVPELVFHSLPPASSAIVVPGFGVYFSPPTGGSFSVSLDRGFEQVSTGRIVAASDNAWLELSCDPSLDCEWLLVQPGSGSSTVVDDAFVDGSASLVSSDARYVIRFGTEPAIYDADDGTVTPFEPPSGGTPQWVPSIERVVAVIGGAEGVELWALDPFDGSTIAVNLASLRAPSPSGGDFTWFG